MKKITLGLIMLFTTTIFAQIVQGDIAFVGYNGDGDDDFAIVALADIPANTTIYFTDSEPNAAGTGMNDAGEGVITWATGASIINAGTVVTFTDIDNDTNPSFGASVGTITRSDAGFSLVVGADGDEVYATLGDPAADEVTVWLTGIEVHDNGRPANFATTGLTPGTNYLVIDATQSKDGGQYTGTRTGKTVSEYKTLIHDEDQWTTHTSDGEIFVPFNTTSFSFLTLSNSFISVDEVVLSSQNGTITTNKGEVVAVYNMLGQQVSNQDLSKGIYIVTVKEETQIVSYKFAL